MLVAIVTHDETQKAAELPDMFYAQRVYKLVEDGLLESQGRINYMRFCEVRIALKT